MIYGQLLRRQGVAHPDGFVGTLLQASFAAHFAMLACVTADIIQRVAIGQLQAAKLGELLGSRVQFEPGDDRLFHALVFFGHCSKPETLAPLCPTPTRNACFLPTFENGAFAGGFR
jgi:hypothetical protein